MYHEYEKYQGLRDALQYEVNRTCIPKFSSEIFSKSEDEKLQLKEAKKVYKDLKKKEGSFKYTRDLIIESIVKTKAPDWGGLSLRF